MIKNITTHFLGIIFLFLGFSKPLSSSAQDGSLDLTFDTDGKVITPIGVSVDNARAAALQSDGKIVVVGRSNNGTNDDFSVTRYNTNGSLDNTFDNDGIVTTPIGSSNDFANAVAIQADGKIVVAGGSWNGSVYVFAVVRYNTNGSLDNTFDGDGIVTTNYSGSNADVGNAIAIQSDGKIVVAGYCTVILNHSFAVVRYNTNGSLDNTFDGDGKLYTTFAVTECVAYAVAIQSDGKIVVGGTHFGIDDDFAVVRYNTNGSLDNTFDTDGMLTTSIGSSNEIGYSMALQPDGKIVLAGFSNNGSNDDFAVVRYNTNGSLDNTFDTDGMVTTPVGNAGDKGYCMVLQSDGKIVVAGSSAGSTGDDFALVRYNANGSLDNTFDTDGKVVTPIGSYGDIAYAVVQQPDGKFIAAGSSYNGTVNNFSLARYNTNGSIDNSFDSDGKTTTAIGRFNDIVYAIAIQSDGRIVAAGATNNGYSYDFAVARYYSGGSMDNSFTYGGKVITPIGSSADLGYAVAIQSDGKIVVAGLSANGGKDNFAVVRYNTNGTLDNTFDGDGKVTTSVGASNDEGYAVAIQGDGKIVVAGTSMNGIYKNFAVVRYNANGSLDNTFDIDGKVTTQIGSGNDFAYAMALQTDGKIVVAGASRNGTNYNFAVVRYNTDGSLDNTFNTNGKVTTAIGSSGDDGRAVAIQNDGKIVVAGTSNNGTNDNIAVVRYNTNGSMDTTFNHNGKVTTAVSGSDIGRAVAIQSDGKILAAGAANNGNVDFAIIRYNANGSIDTSFDGDGKVSTPVGSDIDVGNAMAIQSNGRIVLAGSSFNGTDNDFALVRYNTTITGIEKSSKGFSDFSLYPNPASEFINVKSNMRLSGINYSITDALGRCLIKGQLNTSSTYIDLKELSPGMYFFQVEGQNKTIYKIIKQ